MKKTFEDFLAEKHAKEYMGLDDEMSDAFDDWLTELAVENHIKYADEYTARQRKKDRQEVVDVVEGMCEWKCQNPKCNAIYAEYVNGCPKCATGEVGGSYSVRLQPISLTDILTKLRQTNSK